MEYFVRHVAPLEYSDFHRVRTTSIVVADPGSKNFKREKALYQLSDAALAGELFGSACLASGNIQIVSSKLGMPVYGDFIGLASATPFRGFRRPLWD